MCSVEGISIGHTVFQLSYVLPPLDLQLIQYYSTCKHTQCEIFCDVEKLFLLITQGSLL